MVDVAAHRHARDVGREVENLGRELADALVRHARMQQRMARARVEERPNHDRAAAGDESCPKPPAKVVTDPKNH